MSSAPDGGANLVERLRAEAFGSAHGSRCDTLLREAARALERDREALDRIRSYTARRRHGREWHVYNLADAALVSADSDSSSVGSAPSSAAASNTREPGPLVCNVDGGDACSLTDPDECKCRREGTPPRVGVGEEGASAASAEEHADAVVSDALLVDLIFDAEVEASIPRFVINDGPCRLDASTYAENVLSCLRELADHRARERASGAASSPGNTPAGDHALKLLAVPFGPQSQWEQKARATLDALLAEREELRTVAGDRMQTSDYSAMLAAERARDAAVAECDEARAALALHQVRNEEHNALMAVFTAANNVDARVPESVACLKEAEAKLASIRERADALAAVSAPPEPEPEASAEICMADEVDRVSCEWPNCGCPRERADAEAKP